MRRYTWTVLLAIALVSFLASEVAAQDLHKIKVTAGRNSIISMLYLAGEMAGIFEKNGIDVEVDVRPFKGHMAALPAKEVPCSSYAGTAAIARINKGLDFVIVGGGLTVMQEVFVKKDSPVQSIGDLRGKKFGTWSTGAGAFKATRAVIMDGHGIDVLNKKDLNLVQAAAPALLALLGRGDVDSMFNISSLTVRAASQPDKYRSVFVPNEYWKKKTGQTIVWSAPLVCWREWVDENRDRAKGYANATMESMRWLRNPKNFDQAEAKFAKVTGIKNKAEAGVYRDWLQKKKIFVAKWDQATVDAQWDFLEMAKRRGVLTTVPDKKKHGLILN
jgi:NitT/TauT family transport system substrate-binding protein